MSNETAPTNFTTLVQRLGVNVNITQHFGKLKGLFGVVDNWRKVNQEEIIRFTFWMMLLHLVLIFARDHTLLLALLIAAYMMTMKSN